MSIGQYANTAIRFLDELRGRVPMDTETRRDVLRDLFPRGQELLPYLRRFYALMALAATIATLGLWDDSAAVVIGAMLIAPLMTPVLGVAAATVMGWPGRLGSSVALVLSGGSVAILLAWAIQLLLQTTGTTLPGELLARSDPTLIDLGIAIAAGTAGAYVQIRRKALSALPGVAVAVALVPPLAAVGMFCGLGEWGLAGGALLLYVTNLAGIVAAAAVVYLLSGFTPASVLARERRKVQWGMAVALLGVALVAVPLATNGIRLVNIARDEAAAKSDVEAWLGDSRLEIFTLDIGGDEVEVVLSGPDEPPGAEDLAKELANHLGEPLNLRIVWVPTNEQTVVVGGDASTAASPGRSVPRDPASQ